MIVGGWGWCTFVCALSAHASDLSLASRFTALKVQTPRTTQPHAIPSKVGPDCPKIPAVSMLSVRVSHCTMRDIIFALV